jgi:antitoxin component YwqK of YwqJK toxin-antitoxin module
MKSVIHILLLLFFSRYACAQKEYPDCKQTYFTTGELSSKKCFDTNKRFGKATAYNKTGTLFTKRNCGQSADMLLLNLHFIRTEHSIKPHGAARRTQEFNGIIARIYFLKMGN